MKPKYRFHPRVFQDVGEPTIRVHDVVNSMHRIARARAHELLYKIDHGLPLDDEE